MPLNKLKHIYFLLIIIWTIVFKQIVSKIKLLNKARSSGKKLLFACITGKSVFGWILISIIQI